MISQLVQELSEHKIVAILRGIRKEDGDATAHA
ncbi:2-keto-3-deoxy-6-phosphogluconate aldolase [Cohnella thailandensis]|nr:2-keto-3-deoxy-6-phosphogluconate aldolase [Cohnella thailandensis]